MISALVYGLKRGQELFPILEARGEKRAEVLFDFLMGSAFSDEGFRRKFGRSDIVSIEREAYLLGKKVDRLLRFSDGSLMLVEIKDRQDVRGVVAGIGQALLYVAIAERLWPRAPEIRSALVVWGERDEDVARACGRAGVIYWPIGGPEFIEATSNLVDVLLEFDRGAA